MTLQELIKQIEARKDFEELHAEKGLDRWDIQTIEGWLKLAYEASRTTV